MNTVCFLSRTGKVPIPTPRNRDLVKHADSTDSFSAPSKREASSYPVQPPIPPPRSSTELRSNFTESGYDVDQDSCDQPIDFSQKYSESKSTDQSNAPVEEKTKPVPTKKTSKKDGGSFGDYQETDLDQPTDYSIRYAEHHSESGSDSSEPPGPSADEDTIQHFATEGTPYETPIIFSTSTSMSDLRVIGKDNKPKIAQLKENPEVMTHSDEKDTCSIEDPPGHDNEKPSVVKAQEKRGAFDTKFSSGIATPDQPVNYCDEGTPGYFSRVSSLSSLGEATEEESLAKKNAKASMNVDPATEDSNVSSSANDKESSKAVTFASEPVAIRSSVVTPGASSRNSPPPGDDMVEDTPLMFSRTSSLGSIPECGQPDDQSVHSSISRMTSGCISPSEIPDSPGAPSPRPGPRFAHTMLAAGDQVELADSSSLIGEAACPQSVFSERATTFLVENTPAHFSTATSLSSLTIDDEPSHKPSSQHTMTYCANDKEGAMLSVSSNAQNEQMSVTDSDANKISDRKHESRLPIRTQQSKGNQRDKPKLPITNNLSKNDSLSSLDSFGSTDREIFEQTVNAGLRRAKPADTTRPKAHSVERPSESIKQHRYHKSFDRGDKPKEKVLASSKQKDVSRLESNFAALSMTRSPYSYHGETSSSSLAYHARPRRSRHYEDGPPSLPSRIEHRLERSNSLSSLSNESFGSTDREVFERCVKMGMTKGLVKR